MILSVWKARSHTAKHSIRTFVLNAANQAVLRLPVRLTRCFFLSNPQKQQFWVILTVLSDFQC